MTRRFRFSVRMLAIVVTLVCVYFGSWKITGEYGVDFPENNPEGSCYYESCPMPFVIRRYVVSGADTYYVWLFGAELTLPF